MPYLFCHEHCVINCPVCAQKAQARIADAAKVHKTDMQKPVKAGALHKERPETHK